MTHSISPPQLGWSPFFQQQLSLEEWENYTPGRVVGHHRSHLEVMTEHGRTTLPPMATMPPLTLGDWLLLDGEGRFHRSLDRMSLFTRKAAGTRVSQQLVAANIDTVFVVSSLNEDFNLNRIERYLALAHDAGVEPVVVLTKSDCCVDPADPVRQVQSLDPWLMVEAINALDPASTAVLEPCCGV